MSARKPDRERADRPLQRLRAARERGGEQPPAGRFAFVRRHDIAGASRQPLPIFELPQLGRRHRSGYWNRCRCRSVPARRGSPRRRRCRRRGLPSVSGHSPATAPDARERADFGVGHVGGVDQAPAWIDPCIVEQPLHRPRAERGDALLHLLRLLGGMDVDRPLRASPGNRAQVLGRHRAQRMRRDPDTRARQICHDRAACAPQRQKAVRIVEEARAVRDWAARRRSRHRHRTTAAASARCRSSTLAAAMRAAISPISA